jgi:predicted ATPase
MPAARRPARLLPEAGAAGDQPFRAASVGRAGVRPVPPLAVPDAMWAHAHEPDRVAVLQRSEAVRLFLDRARAVQPDFAVSAAEAVALADICRRLDGLPLAIELAAARVRLLPLMSLAAHLAGPSWWSSRSTLRTISRRAQTLPPRPQSAGQCVSPVRRLLL